MLPVDRKVTPAQDDARDATHDLEHPDEHGVTSWIVLPVPLRLVGVERVVPGAGVMMVGKDNAGWHADDLDLGLMMMGHYGVRLLSP